MKLLLALAFMVLVLVGFALPVMGADSYPTESIIYSIPFNPGGQSDLEARRQQPLLEKELGVDVVIQYKPGSGSLGWAELMHKKPNGYFISGINIPHIILQPLPRGSLFEE